MIQPNATAGAEARQSFLNDLIEAFEKAHDEHREVNLAEFLPAQNHPFYLEARRELLRVDLELSWHDGRRRHFQDYAKQFPDLLQDQATVQEVAFEEYRLRTLAGEAPATTEYTEKYGVATNGWAPSADLDRRGDVDLIVNMVRTLSDGNSWLSSRHGHAARVLLREFADRSSAESVSLLAQTVKALPEIGNTFLNFRLIAELGHGSFGRVYLARQGDLANRLVALKITVDLRGEEQKLAQLQHTNVVPIYSAHQACPFQAVCMPYFGATTLADVIHDLQSKAPATRSGRDIVGTVRSRHAAIHDLVHHMEGLANAGEASSESGAELKALEESTYPDAILDIAKSVTEGLIHAHERGILHRDLKPANILLTDEGRPMLVDFNLSAEKKPSSELGELQVGGTLPYMAPEHLEAMLGSNRPADAGSDIYALGVVLFELLTGRQPFSARAGQLSEILPLMIADRRQDPPRLRPWNPAVSPALESIVRHCLQSDPARRYRSAEELHEDLKRQRHHRPLRHAPEPSMRERTRKWVRRHPRLTSRSSIAAMVCTLVLCCAAPFAVEAWGEWQDANARKLQDALADARQADEEKRRLEETVSATDRDRRSQKDALEKLSKFEDDTPSSRPIMEIVSVLQMLPEAWPHEEKLLAAAMAECRRWLQFYDVLDDADWQRQPAVRDLPPAERERLRLKITELLYALAHAEQASLARLRDETRPFTMVSSAAMITGFGLEIRGALEATVRARFLPAERLNEQACTCFDNQIWYLARQKLELTQLRDNGKTLEPFLVDKLPPRGELDERCWAARMLIAEGRFAVALPLLDQATALSPDHSEAWLLMAWCHYNLKNARKAEFCYDSYLDLQPTSIWGYYGRGLFFLSEKNWASAERDFGWVVKQLPDLAWAYSHRASARKGMGKDAGAIKDLTHAIDLAPEVPGFYLLRAQLHAAVGNRELAEQDRRRFLQHEPNGFVGWLYRGIARRSTDPQGALADFEKALALNPRDPLTLLNKARLLADAFGRPREAIKVLNEVIELEPDLLVLDARFQRGMILAKTGQRDRAVDDAEQLIRREPTPSRCYEAASIYASTSRKDDAVLALQLLRFALRHGHGVSKYQTDPNLRSLANLAEFRRLAEGLRILGAQDPFPPGK